MSLTKPKTSKRTRHHGKAKPAPAASSVVTWAISNGREERRPDATVAGLTWRTFEESLGEPHWRDWLRRINGC